MLGFTPAPLLRPPNYEIIFSAAAAAAGASFLYPSTVAGTSGGTILEWVATKACQIQDCAIYNARIAGAANLTYTLVLGGVPTAITGILNTALANVVQLAGVLALPVGSRLSCTVANDAGAATCGPTFRGLIQEV